MRLSPGQLRHVGSFRKKDGSIGVIMRWPAVLDPDDNGPLAWEEEPVLFKIGEVQIKPMEIPTGGIFYANFEYLPLP
jgi:hypothetical protein